MLSKPETLMSLNSKQKSICQLETTELFPKETKKKGNSKKMTKTRLGLLMPWISGSHNHADPCFLA